MAAGILTVGHVGFLNMTLNLVWTSPGITGVKIMGTLMELKGAISPSVTCVRRRVPWGQNIGINVFLREFPTSPFSCHHCKDGWWQGLVLGVSIWSHTVISSKVGPTFECLLLWSPNRARAGRLIQAVSCLCALHRPSDCHRGLALFTSFRVRKGLVGTP